MINWVMLARRLKLDEVLIMKASILISYDWTDDVLQPVAGHAFKVIKLSPL